MVKGEVEIFLDEVLVEECGRNGSVELIGNWEKLVEERRE